KIEIKYIFFVATPHFGAPQILQAFLHKESLINFELADKWVSGPLNKYGPTFDSIYELFPFSHAYRKNFSSDVLCITSSKRNSNPAYGLRVGYRKQGLEARPRPVDIFSAATLLQFGISDKFDIIGVSDKQSYLQDKLDRAKTAICDLVEFEMPR